MLDGHWHFHCPECGMGDFELGHLAGDQELFCEVCQKKAVARYAWSGGRRTRGAGLRPLTSWLGSLSSRSTLRLRRSRWLCGLFLFRLLAQRSSSAPPSDR